MAGDRCGTADRGRAPVHDPAGPGIADLRQQLTEHQRELELRAQVDDLTAKLAAAKDELKSLNGKRPALSPVDGVDTKAVRRWAAANGVDCPRMGRIPGHVIDAWRAAQ